MLDSWSSSVFHGSSFVSFLLAKKVGMSLVKDREDTLKTLHWIHIVSRFSHLKWKISCFQPLQEFLVMIQ
jgi:hypothetical protein